ncbi:MAG: phage Gp37/Gp68 family protein [Candidatus Hydrogenedens sp.]|nr:phage Gp37/Gp68 family protein [Candidatus Hydrogenedens sp.]
MSTSRIEWTESTWNPVTGCTKISTGCKNCYAERMAKRLQAMGQPNYKNGFEVAAHEEMLLHPLTWKKPRLIFVNSMSDLFHSRVPLSFITKVFETMHKANWHQFQILTKRSKRLLELDPHLSWAPNIWMGVSVENSDTLYRVNDLQKTESHLKFISFEPLLGPVGNVSLQGIDWVIAGGESGPKARPVKPEWVTDIRNQCKDQKVPFFFKQWGGVNKKKTGRLLDGKLYDEMPEFSIKASA